MFVADLARFVDAWRSGIMALAIVPAVASTTPTSTWHVAFNGRDRAAEGVVPITATVTYGELAEPASTIAPPAVQPPARPTSLAPGSLDPADLVVDLDPPAASGEIVAALAPSSATVQPIRHTSSSGFRYRAIFYLPLVVLAVGAILARAFTRPITIGRA